MNFQDSVKSGFRNWVNFKDRASRSEFWFLVLFSILLGFISGLVDGLLNAMIGIQFVNLIAVLALTIPSLSVTIRRLHDLDKSGWWVLLCLIPLVGIIILTVWYATKGTFGPNRFGPDPLALEE